MICYLYGIPFHNATSNSSATNLNELRVLFFSFTRSPPSYSFFFIFYIFNATETLRCNPSFILQLSSNIVNRHQNSHHQNSHTNTERHDQDWFNQARHVLGHHLHFLIIKLPNTFQDFG